MRPARFFFFLLAISLCFTPRAQAQVPDPIVNDAAPIPGAGHHYIGTGAEIVSPADGLLSFSLPVQVPAGRQVTPTFGFLYSSSEPYYFAVDFGPWLTWYPRPYTGAEKGGWSYDLPTLTWSDQVQSFLSTYTGQPPQGQVDHQCDDSANYVFRAPDGTQYQLNLGSNWVDINYRSTTPPTVCSNNNTIGSSVQHGVIATTPTSWIDWSSQPPVTVVDQSGTTYQFPSWPAYTVQHGSPAAIYAVYVSAITDRNGNQIGVLGTDTLGRTPISMSGFGSDGDHVSIAGLSGNIVLHWASVPVTHPGTGHSVTTKYTTTSCGVLASSPASIRAVTEIDLPNSTKYAFSYDPTYGRPSKIAFPEGGYVRYVWGLNTSSAVQSFTVVDQYGNQQYCDMIYDTAAVTDRYVSYDGSTEVLHQHFVYSTTWDGTNPQSWDKKTTTVTSTDLLTNQVTATIYNFVPSGYGAPAGGPYSFQLNSDASMAPAVEASVIYQDGSGHTLKTVNKTWLSTFVMVGEQTVLNNGQGMTALSCYDANEQVTDIYEYGFQSEGSKPPDPSCASSVGLNTSAIGPLRRHTITAYHNFLGASTPTHILNEPDSVTVYDGSGSQAQQTIFTYDANSAVASGAATGLVAPAGLRGNASTVTHWLNAGGSSPVTSYTYFDTGQVQTVTDPCGNATCSDISGSNHTTTYSYADSFASGTGTPPGQTNAYLTQITHPNTGVAHIEKSTWGYSDGLMRSSVDQNNQITSYTYNTPPAGCAFPDGLDRLSQVSFPDGGQTMYCYNDTPYNPSTPSPNVATTKTINSSANMTVLSAMDGLGHSVRSVLTSDPDCASGDRADTTYGGFGHLQTVSNLYCTTGDSTYGVTNYSYDALGRTTQVTHPDSSTALTSYTGRATQVQDEGNGTQRVTRISQLDSLGRLISMCEVAPGPFIGSGGASSSSLIGQSGTPAACGQDISGQGFLTTYQYDVLGNLLGATQGTMPSRSFAYDSLSRLNSASNPESGTIAYTYDANSNVLTKTAPAPNQAGGTVVTSYAYDALNRLLSKSYNDGKTPTATFIYDASTVFTNLTNPIGRLVESTTPSSAGGCIATFSEYDPMGRVAEQYQYTPMSSSNCSNFYSLPYTYDYLGNMTSASDGYFHIYTYHYNSASRLIGLTSSFSNSQNPATLLSGSTYNAAGQIASDTLGTSEIETYTYTKRNQLQAETTKLSATQTYAYGLTFAPNRDITAATDSVNGNWTYAYDPFNRLVGANQNSGAAVYSYVYDRFGNRWQQNGPHTMLESFTGNNTTNDNRMDGYSYDAAGNLLNDGTSTYTYDAENRIVQVAHGSTIIATYLYDANGQRVHRTGVITDTCDGTGKRDYVYDLAGHWTDEVNSNGTSCKTEIYAGRRHFVTNGGGTYFDHSDWLGTVRLRNSFQYPNQFETCTSLPFGDAQTCVGGDLSTIHFTGKERDAESGLDNFGARYNSSTTGRFMSPDRVVFAADRVFEPQKLNLYAYATNNPMRFIDPTGAASIDSALLSGINDLKSATHQAAQQMVADWNKGTPGLYSPNLAAEVAAAASAADELKTHFNDASDTNALNNYESAMGSLEGKIQDSVGATLLSQLQSWATDPTTSVADLKAAIGDIELAEHPNEGNEVLKKSGEQAFNYVLERAGKAVERTVGVLGFLVDLVPNPNSQLRQNALGRIRDSVLLKEEEERNRSHGIQPYSPTIYIFFE